MVIHTNNIDALPEEVGYRLEKLKELDDLFIELIERKRLQCASYLLARNGKVFAHKSMGKLTYADDSSDFMPDSYRKIASITKIFVATSIMQLMERGKLYLYQAVKDIIEEFNCKYYDGITIYHLLTHSSGLSADAGYFVEPNPREWWKFNKGGNWIKEILTGPPQCKPGEQWNYCTAGFYVLGEIISRLSGIHYTDYIVENILKPLGMNDTFFIPPEDASKNTCFTNIHEKEWYDSMSERKFSPYMAGGGITSTLHDLFKFGQMMLNKGSYNGAYVLSRKSIELMSRNQLSPNTPAFYWGAEYKNFKMGLGAALFPRDESISSPDTFGHEGAGRSALFIDPLEQFIAVFMTPTNLDWVPESVINPRNIMWSGLI